MMYSVDFKTTVSTTVYSTLRVWFGLRAWKYFNHLYIWVCMMRKKTIDVVELDWQWRFIHHKKKHAQCYEWISRVNREGEFLIIDIKRSQIYLKIWLIIFFLKGKVKFFKWANQFLTRTEFEPTTSGLR